MLRPGPALVLALALIASTRAFGADYYVKQGGDNNKTGLNSGQAWASLDRACGAGPTLAVAPGDTVHVAAGTYPGFVCDGLQALAGQFVKILSATPGGAIFTDTSHPCAQFKNNQYIHFEGFAFGACSGSGVRVEASNHIEVVGCTFQGTGTNNSIAVVGSTAVLLHGNTISSAPGNGIGIATLAATRSSDVALAANRISRCGGAGVGIVGGDNVSAINNLIYRNHDGGLVLTDGSLTALNNTVFQDTGDGWCLAVGASTNWLTSKDNILLNAGTNGAIKAADDNTVGKCASNANVLTDRFQIGPNWIQYTKWVNQAGTPDLLSGLSNAPTEFRDYASDNYHLAMGASRRIMGDPHRRRAQPLASVELDGLAQEVRSTTAIHLKRETSDALAKLRAHLDFEEQTLLVLRVDRDLPWTDIATILGEEGRPVGEAALRKRFERLKTKIRNLAVGDGLLPG